MTLSRSVLYLLLLIGSAGCAATSQANDPQLELQWLGGPTLLIRFNGKTLMTDPMLGDGEQAFWMADPNQPFDLAEGPQARFFKRYSPLPEVAQQQPDIVLLSHAHEDHFDQQAQQQLAKDRLIYLPLADQDKVRGYGFQQLQALEAGQQRQIRAGDGHITITAIPADHSAAADIQPILGQGLGYVLNFRHGDWQKTLYWSGDSLPTARVLDAVKQHLPLDIAVLNMGAVGTPGPLGLISMNAEQAVRMSQALNATRVLPIHHSTFDLYLEPVSRLQQLAEEHDIAVDIISAGSSLLYR